MLIKVFHLVLGGAFGTLSRYFLSGFIYRLFGAQFPFGTLIVNLCGCFALGVFSALSDSKFLGGPGLRLFLMIGFCGAFTTFSTFIFETNSLIKDGETFRAFVNLMSSVALGFIALRVGLYLGDAL